MKNPFITSILLLSVLLNFSMTGKANNNEIITSDFPTDTVFQFVDTQPKFPGGLAALMAFFSENIIHPAEVRDTGWQGRIVVQFVVRKTGEITDVNILHGVFPPMDKEVVRTAKLIPNWIPGKHNGEKVNVNYTLPINLNVQPLNYDTAPQFPGGDEALLQYLLENIQYPPYGEEGFPRGRVVLQFNVLTSGKISDIEVVSGVSPKLDAEVVRVVEAMPGWIPAKRDGEKVDAPFLLPVNFLVVWLRAPMGFMTSMIENFIEDLYAAQPGDFIFPITQKPPYFPGGETALMEFLRLNMRYPANAIRWRAQGRVLVNFVVRLDGRIRDVQVVESTISAPNRRNLTIREPIGERSAVRRSMEREAVRVVSTMPDWLPAEQMGKKVNFRFTLPVRFELQ